jgi:peptidoglycan/LPS O-acetylase OafA/YrhL
LFFLISGFIFFWLYADRIADRTVSITEFWVLRITRLYPLHLVTLILVAGLQFLFHKRTGQYFSYGINDLRHFVLGLLFFQVNGPGGAFNGPAWSITVELVVYGVFCIAAWAGVFRYATAPLLIFLVGLFFYSKHQNIAMGICGFFEGGFIYFAFSWACRSPQRHEIFFAATAASMIGWLIILAGNYARLAMHTDLVNGILPLMGMIPRLCVTYILFPLTIFSLALHENSTEARYRHLSWLGEISYSSYLLHFPLQLIFALAVVAGFVPLWATNSDAFLLTYFAILISISVLSFRHFETPVQRMLRRAWREGSRAVFVPSGKA